ncbi:MAG: ribosomal protein large subunit ribosomal protein [Candidatus Taylorbacteria bacterium]|nr:ribosomal protein large subunit ribosomal protein [Candidatus Taylorbacteria bacterium]
MQLHTLIPVTKNKKVMIVGRGGKRGKTSGRGGKGQTARAGNKRRPELRDFIKRLPKLRGRGISPQKSFGGRPFIINLGIIEANFEAGAIVTPATLSEKKLVTTMKGRLPEIKILGAGDFTKPIKVSGCIVSGSAKEMIEKAGGSVTAVVAKASPQKPAKIATGKKSEGSAVAPAEMKAEPKKIAKKVPAKA